MEGATESGKSNGALRFQEREYKTILNKLKFIDGWFWCRYTLNPYNGCRFGCVYCDARSEKYHQPEDFENSIIIKKDPGAMLHERLGRSRTPRPDVIALGGATACYQGAEKKYRNTRGCLQAILKHGYAAHILTKSHLALEDLELLREIDARSWSAVSFTITTVNTATSRLLDKRAPDPGKRLRALEEFRRAGVRAGALLIPLVPGLCDSEKDLRALFGAVRDAGADYILFGGGMTLRDRQGFWFLEHLQAARPELMPLYEDLYGFSFQACRTAGTYTGRFTPRDEYFREKNALLPALAREYKLPTRIKRFIPDDFRRLNYIIAERLLNEAYVEQTRGRFRRDLHWAGHNIQNLRESIAELKRTGRLASIGNLNGELLERVSRWITEEDDSPGLFN